jgi:DNA-binding NarL/FixJ family response regulator
MPRKTIKSRGRLKKPAPPTPRKSAGPISRPVPPTVPVSSPRPPYARQLKIAVAAQPPLFRELLSRQLEGEPSLVVIGRAGNEDQIEKLLVQESPLVLVFDYEGLGPNGESIVHRLRRAAPTTRILVLASRSSDETVQRVLRAGASGLVGKQLEFTVLVRAIHAVAAGEVWANRRATSAALEGLTGSSVTGSKSDLTKREQEIADGCSRGLRNKEIAAHLNISAKTVKSHLNNIFRKFQVDNRLALALLVSERVQPKT